MLREIDKLITQIKLSDPHLYEALRNLFFNDQDLFNDQVDHTPMQAYNTTFLTLTANYAPIPGLYLTLNKKNMVWLILVSVIISIDHLDTYINVKLSLDSSQQKGQIQANFSSALALNPVITSNRPWIVNSISGTEKVEVIANKTAGTGASQILASPLSHIMGIPLAWNR